MEAPIISIIIPTYNRAHLIIETLQSISKQTYTLWECILIDDDSTDDTIQVIKNYIKNDNRFSIHQRPEHLPKGANACRNYGFELSKGSYIQFFDSDDIMLSHCLEDRKTVVEKENLDFVAFAMSDIIEGEIIDNPPLYMTNSQDDALEEFIKSRIIPWNLQRTLFRKSFLNKDNLFNTNLQRFQDIEFNIRLLINGNLLFKMINTVDCYYRTAGNNNPRQDSFYNDVFLSIPEYYRSITSNISKDVLHRNQLHLQKWLYYITALYTRKKVKVKLFSKAIKSGKQYINLSFKQSIILYILFYIKKYPKLFIGRIRVLKFLKTIY